MRLRTKPELQFKSSAVSAMVSKVLPSDIVYAEEKLLSYGTTIRAVVLGLRAL
jgi:hypothetical protein